jgi:DNA-binding winged helix-turn-helix (wHTH) protein/TolB-like protein/tetratricopeptide (TPR) repeat protein
VETPATDDVLAFDDFRLDARQRLLSRDGREIPLSPKAVEILLVLVRQRGRIVGKNELLDAVWKNVVVEESNLYGYLHVLRTTLGNAPDGRPYVETLRRRGYRFNGEIVAAARDAALHAGASRDVDAAPASPPGRTYRLPVLVGTLLLASLALATAFLLPRDHADSRAGTQAPIRTLAVLPFKPVAESARNEAFELGMTDSLIGLLGQSKLVVRPVGTVRRFGALDQDPIAAGRELGVDAVVDGTINVVADRVRITASLWRVADGRQLWSGKFDARFSGIFDIQDSISKRVADAVNAELAVGRRRYTQNTEAYRLYLLGNHHAQLLTPRDYAIAIQYFRQAIAMDPDYPWPYIGIATADRVIVLSADAPPSERMAEGKRAAEKAVALAPELAEAHVALGMIEFFHDWDWDQAIAQLERAHDLAPDLEDTNIELAQAYSNLGRSEDALRLSTRAGVIDPLSPRRWALHGQFLFYAGRNEESVRHLRKAMQTLPDFWLPHLFIQWPYLATGRYEDVIAEADRARRLGSYSLENTVNKACAYAGLGNTAEARRLLAGLEETATKRYIGPYLLAVVYNALGETGSALTLLEKAYRTRDWRMTFLLVDPRWDNLRSEPRFMELMREMKFDATAARHRGLRGRSQPASSSAAATISSSFGITRNAAPASGV